MTATVINLSSPFDRPGARYPTLDSATATFATKVQNATVNGTGFTATGDLAFLNTWTYRVRNMNDDYHIIGIAISYHSLTVMTAWRRDFDTIWPSTTLRHGCRSSA